MITKRERELKEKGYHYYLSFDYLEDAKKTAKILRENSYYNNATVLTEQKNGIPYYSVWARRIVKKEG